MAQKAPSTSLRIGFFRSWKSKWYGDKEYSYLLAQDYKIRDYLNNIFICTQLPTSEFMLKRKIGAFIYTHANIYIPIDKRNQLLFFRRFFFFFKNYRQSFKFYFRKIGYFFSQFKRKLFSFFKRSIFFWKEKQLSLIKFFFYIQRKNSIFSFVNSYSFRIKVDYYSHSIFYIYPLFFFKLYNFRHFSKFFSIFYSYPVWILNIPFLLNKKSVKGNNLKEAFISSPSLLAAKKKLLFRRWIRYYKKILHLIKFYKNYLNFGEKELLGPSIFKKFLIPFFEFTLSIRQFILFFLSKLFRVRIMNYFNLFLLSPLKGLGLPLALFKFDNPQFYYFFSKFYSIKKSGHVRYIVKAFKHIQRIICILLAFNVKQNILYHNYVSTLNLNKKNYPYTLALQLPFRTLELCSRIRSLRRNLLFRAVSQVSYAIEAVLASYTGSRVLFFPRYFIGKLPSLKSAKLTSLYIKYELEKGAPFFEVIQFIKKWAGRAMRLQRKMKYASDLFSLEGGFRKKRSKKTKPQAVKKPFKKILFRKQRINREKNIIVRKMARRFKKDSSRILYLRGIKISFSGRMNRRNMMSQTEWYKKGPVPTQLLRSYVDYYNCTAQTKLGSIGIKVWLFLVLEKDFF